MNWDAIGSLAEILGAIGVIASLVYVGMQVRQNTRTMHAASIDAYITSSNFVRQQIVANAKASRALFRIPPCVIGLPVHRSITVVHLRGRDRPDRPTPVIHAANAHRYAVR